MPDHQAIQFRLADMATKVAVARQMVLHAASLRDAGERCLKEASMAKLFASERAYVCADRCVQAWGGRAYMRRNAAERLLRELRVDRIWEGTSEIQRLIVANALVKRGVPATLAVDRSETA